MDAMVTGDAASDAAVNASLLRRFDAVRQHSGSLAALLSAEDQAVQSMPDASPVKWHLAHTTWFFEQFVLRTARPDYRIFDPDFGFLFNSYYEAVGPRHARVARGVMTRPSAAQVRDYRAHVNEAMRAVLTEAQNEPTDLAGRADLADLVVLGLNHEQQHQELMITDITHAFAQNPLLPAAIPGWRLPVQARRDPPGWVEFAGGLVEIGYHGEEFHFDNEGPCHSVWLAPYALADQLVPCATMLDFIADGGYQTPTLWMADGWAQVQAQGWTAPLYWRQADDQWWGFGPGGSAPIDPQAPLVHISWYEADALARWAGARLPTEAEWEAAYGDPRLASMTGVVWQWTESAYRPYPGFRPVAGAIGEYNGKFMINQMVLRGSSAATPMGHARASYRNFFHPDKRWQFSGLRLARDC
jgi:ergothioneine biosynthesis protein EgtB